MLSLDSMSLTDAQHLRQDVFFTYEPSQDALAGEDLRLTADDEPVGVTFSLPALEELQQLLSELDAVKAGRLKKERLAVVFGRVAEFFRVFDPATLGESGAGGRLEQLRARRAAADSALREARAAVKLARTVYRDTASDFLKRFMESLKFHLDGEQPGSPVAAALLERAAETSRLEVLADAGLPVEYGNRAIMVNPSDAERFLLEQERNHATASVRTPERRHQRFGFVSESNLPLVVDVASAARDWGRSEIRYAGRFKYPVLTSLPEMEKRHAELAAIDSAVDKILNRSWSIAEQLVKFDLFGQLSADARSLCERFTGTRKHYVESDVSAEQVQLAEARRTQLDRLTLLQKRLARMSSHPSILYARDEDQRQQAAFSLACQCVAAR
jgi:hypothetical protein